MRCFVSVLYVVALVMQLGGAWFVIADVVRNTKAMRKFVAEWKRLTETQGLNWPDLKQPVLAELMTAHNINAWCRWTPVGFLILGVILGFLGNELSLHITPLTGTPSD